MQRCSFYQSVGILLEPCGDHGDSEDGCLER